MITSPDDSNSMRPQGRALDTHVGKARMALSRLACRPEVGAALAAFYKDRIPHRGALIRTDHPAVSPRTKASLRWGFYERAEIDFAQRYLRPSVDCVELGTSIGVLAVHVARRLSISSRLICVEANPELADIAESNLRMNAPHANVTMIRAAISFPHPEYSSRFVPGALSTDGKLQQEAGSYPEANELTSPAFCSQLK